MLDRWIAAGPSDGPDRAVSLRSRMIAEEPIILSGSIESTPFDRLLAMTLSYRGWLGALVVVVPVSPAH